MEPQADSQEVRRLFNMSCGSEGWFLEKHPKLAPVSTFTDGVFIAGCCQGPKDIPTASPRLEPPPPKPWPSSTGATSNKSQTRHMSLRRPVPDASHAFRCVRTQAISLDQATQKAIINEALCKGCGTCVASCPSGSIGQHLFEDDRSSAKSKDSSVNECPHCTLAASYRCVLLQLVHLYRGRPGWCFTPEVPPQTSGVIRLMCSGRVDPQFVLDAFAKGADGVLIGGCHPGDCHYVEGNYKTLRRLKMLTDYFKSLASKRAVCGWNGSRPARATKSAPL